VNRTLVLCALVLLIGACGCVSKPEIDLQGTWSGDWSSGQTTGTLDITFDGRTPFGDMKTYDVVLLIHGPTCPSGDDRAAGDRSAAFKDDDVHIAVRFAGAAPGADENVFRFDGTLSGSRAIIGSYALISDSCPSCTCAIGASGIWRAFR
jgi:hypothetical protein